jgi:hypothetical protein
VASELDRGTGFTVTLRTLFVCSGKKPDNSEITDRRLRGSDKTETGPLAGVFSALFRDLNVGRSRLAQASFVLFPDQIDGVHR